MGSPDEASPLRDADSAAIRGAAAVLTLAERGVLAVTGPQRQKFLQGLLSNDVAGRAAGQGCRAALMDVKGHQLVWMRALVSEDAVLLEADSARLGLLERLLVHYRVATPVRFALQPACVLALLGPQARAVLERAGAEVAELGIEDHRVVTLAGEQVRLARAGDLPAAGWVLHASAAAGPQLRGALVEAGARAIGREALDVARIEEGRAWHGVDVDEENLLHETGLIAEYHSPSKGCYVGQEVVARLEGRGGNVNKRLRGLRLSAPVAAGAEIRVAGESVGRVTTAGLSPRLGPIAMGYVQRAHAAPGAQVELAGATATVAELPLLEATR